MQTWLQVSDLIEEYGTMDFPLDENNQPNLDRVGSAIADGQYFVEGYLRKAGMAIPVDSEIQRQVRKAAMVMTRYYYSFSTDLMTNELIREYGETRKFLSDIATGKTVLESGTGTGVSKGGIRNINLFII